MKHSPRYLLSILAVWPLTALFLWPIKYQLWAGAISSSSFFLAQAILPKCRLSFRLTPLNWLLAAFALQLMVMPACVVLFGPSIFALPSLPSTSAVNVAILLITLAFWSCCLSVQFSRNRPRTAVNISLPSRTLACCFIVIGLLGLALKFGGLDGFVQYATNPAIILALREQNAGESATLAQAAATLLTPFLGFGWIMLFCRTIDTKRRFRWWSIGLIIAIACSYVFMNYNRGSLAVPMVALIAVIAKRMKDRAFPYLLVASLSALSLVYILTIYRFDSLDLTKPTSTASLMDMIQDYGAAPQYAGYFLQRRQFGRELTFGKMITCSTLSPMPVAGKAFRQCSGTAQYNDAIGRYSGADQIAPFTIEAFSDFHVFGIIAGFALLGCLLAKIQARFESSRSAIEVYMLQFAAVWLGFLTVGSIDVISQIAVYSSLPIYGYLLFSRRYSLRHLNMRVLVDNRIVPAGSSGRAR